MAHGINISGGTVSWREYNAIIIKAITLYTWRPGTQARSAEHRVPVIAAKIMVIVKVLSRRQKWLNYQATANLFLFYFLRKQTERLRLQ